MTKSPQQLIDQYKNGLPACHLDLASQEEAFESGYIIRPGDINLDDLVKRNPGDGKRATLWRSREKFDKGAYGQEAQTGPDCVSHGDRNARDTTRCVEIDIKNEPEEYVARGATEPTYAARQHLGAGMNPVLAAKYVTEYGWLVRKKYPFGDFTVYNHRLGAQYSTPPSSWKEACREHNVGWYVRPETVAQAKALFYNGYACHSGQNIGFADNTNSNGVHPRQGSWNHDMATVGYDDTKEIWKETVYFVQNSWGNFNNPWQKWVSDKAIQALLGPPIVGMIIVSASVWENYFLGGGSIYFYGDVAGFPAKKLPNYGTGSFLA